MPDIKGGWQSTFDDIMLQELIPKHTPYCGVEIAVAVQGFDTLLKRKENARLCYRGYFGCHHGSSSRLSVSVTTMSGGWRQNKNGHFIGTPNLRLGC